MSLQSMLGRARALYVHGSMDTKVTQANSLVWKDITDMLCSLPLETMSISNQESKKDIFSTIHYDRMWTRTQIST